MKQFLLLLLLPLCLHAQQKPQHYPLKNMLGAVCHPWDLVASVADYNNADFETQAKISAVIDAGLTGLRIYNNVERSKEDNNTTYRLSPDRSGFAGDSVLFILKARNPDLKILYCFQNAPDNIQMEYTAVGEKNTTYVHRDADRLNPASYGELAHDMYVLACRGGTNANVPDYPVWKSPWWYERIQPMYKGARIYDMLEGGNECDNKWSNTRPLNGYEYAAMWSAVYDSIKKANAGVEISTTGVMDGWPTILNQAIDWCRANRGGRMPFDAYQFHCYSSGLWDLGIVGAFPPELTGSKQVQAVVDAANSVNVRAFVGEWGYDIASHSNLGIISFGGYSPDQIRAWWSARSILDWNKIGLWAAYYYRIYQDYGAVNDSNATTFASASLFLQYGDTVFKRRLVGDMFKQMTLFNNYVFDTAILDNDSVKLYRFTDGTNRMYTGWTVERMKKVQLWGSTRPEFTERFYSVNKIPAGTRYDINEDSSGVFFTSKFNGGNVYLSSKPFFVVEQQISLPVHVLSFTAEKTGQSVMLTWKVQDAERIDVERSQNGRLFSVIGKHVTGGRLLDLNPPQTKLYYRLKMYEADGSYSYSAVRSVTFEQRSRQVRCYNILGQLMREGSSDHINAWKASLPRGIYLLKYGDGGAGFTERIVIY